MGKAVNWRRIMGATSSWSVLAVVLAFGAEDALAQAAPVPAASAAAAQDSAPPATSQTEPAKDEIVVVGSRASQQSAINRKKRARTATDSIVADDIGSFPDRNVAEAVSRVPGVALNRNEFGEGDGIAVRGNGGGLTRVELDGLAVQSTFGVALGADNGRTADLRELPADLVKSIDVVKGSTPDMTEGSLGGTVQIQTRTGLDFKKPYYSLRAGGQMNTLSKKWTPDFNGVATRKFFGDRLGVIVSGAYTRIMNDSHSMENTTSNTRNYARLIDFDNSPDKTFSYNLDTLGTDDADLPFANSFQPNGQPGLTPRQLLTMAASAQSKAQCFTLFPNNPTGTTAQRAQRISEQQSCLNQWNDSTPSLIRHFMPSQDDRRLTLDARADFKVTDNLTVYVKGTQANRKIDDQFRTRTPVSLFGQNVAGTFVDTTTGYPRIRTVSPAAPPGYFLYDPQYGLTNQGNNATLGQVLNVVPSSVVVDEDHNVTGMTLTNNSVNIDQIANKIDIKTRYLQGGAEYRLGRLAVNAMAGMSKARSTRADMRTARSYAYGDATLALQPSGLWDITLPANYDETNIANFVQLNPARCISGGTNPNTCVGQAAVAASPTGPATPAYTPAQMPLTTPSFGVSYSPRLGATSERQAKLDLTYSTEGLVPFITRIKVGAMYRNNTIDAWGGGGYTVKSAIGTFGQPGYVPAVIVPTANVRGSYRACQPTATSSAPGGLSCNYGFVQSTNPATARQGVDTLTAQELQDLFARTIENRNISYFGDFPAKGSLPPAWAGIKVDELFRELGAWQFMNFDCLKRCTASDGTVYDQPVTSTDETIKNIYGMEEFEQRLPLGLLFNGNFGVRGVFTNVNGSGLMTIRSLRLSDPNNPASAIIDQSFSENTSVKARSVDWLPSFNLNLWGFNETVVLRAYGGKTVSRPTPSRLLPAGTCTIDERMPIDDEQNPQGCSGRVGNPSLKPFTAWNYNLSLEWYPNKDTMLSVAYGRLDVKIGNPISVTKVFKPFAGSGRTDPATGESLDDVEFNVPTYENGPGYKRAIWEVAGKTAFTFLPWYFRYLGADANISILKSIVSTGARDPNTGDVMLPPDESKYYTNASLWYDDGRLNMRVAYQKRSSRFSCITPCGGNTVDFNYPGETYTNVRLPYNPGVPRFIDGSTFIDAKASYNITSNLQVYVEGRNMTREAQSESTGGYENFADGTPKIMRLRYSGRRFMAGVVAKFGAPK